MERPQDYETLKTLDISNKGLIELPSWVSQCHNLKELDCSYNKITKIQNLPPTLEILVCSRNKITYLDNLPQTLKILFCSNNYITQLDNLPPTLIILWCNNNKITRIGYVPTTLEFLACSNNSFKYNFKPTLENIRNYNNQNKLSK